MNTKIAQFALGCTASALAGYSWAEYSMEQSTREIVEAYKSALDHAEPIIVAATVSDPDIRREFMPNLHQQLPKDWGDLTVAIPTHAREFYINYREVKALERGLKKE